MGCSDSSRYDYSDSSDMDSGVSDFESDSESMLGPGARRKTDKKKRKKSRSSDKRKPKRASKEEDSVKDLMKLMKLDKDDEDVCDKQKEICLIDKMILKLKEKKAEIVKEELKKKGDLCKRYNEKCNLGDPSGTMFPTEEPMVLGYDQTFYDQTMPTQSAVPETWGANTNIYVQCDQI